MIYSRNSRKNPRFPDRQTWPKTHSSKGKINHLLHIRETAKNGGSNDFKIEKSLYRNCMVLYNDMLKKSFEETIIDNTKKSLRVMVL